MSLADDPQTIDDLGFNQVTDNQLFSRSLTLTGESDVNLNNLGLLRLSSEWTIEDSDSAAVDDGYNLDRLMLGYLRSGGRDAADVSRFSATWDGKSNSVSIGNDWSNFQDVLAGPGQTEIFSTLKPAPTAQQIRWTNGQGLSFSLEDDYSFDSKMDELMEDNDGRTVVMSLDRESSNGGGQYRFSALGSQQDSRDASVQNDSGWGLNMSGGWQFGDVFAALSVTVGNGIDHLLLGRLGDEMPSGSHLAQGDSIMINPRINYALNDSGNLHLELNHYRSQDSQQTGAIDTLDTIHLGYSWSPWPSTKFGVELMGKDVESRSISQESTRLTIGAEKRF
ncbi:MAG: hypothetical protein AAF402_07855 [Pseudomonadota bacterium]